MDVLWHDRCGDPGSRSGGNPVVPVCSFPGNRQEEPVEAMKSLLQRRAFGQYPNPRYRGSLQEHILHSACDNPFHFLFSVVGILVTLREILLGQ